MRLARPDRIARSGAHMIGSAEVGLADLQVNHVVAGALQRTGAREHREGGLGPEALEARGEPEVSRGSHYCS